MLISALLFGLGGCSPRAINEKLVLNLSADPVLGVAPLKVRFAAAAITSNKDTLSYAWGFGDGDTASGGPTAIHTYAYAGPYSASVLVAAAAGGSATAHATIEVAGVVGSSSTPAFALDARRQGDYAYVAESMDGLEIFDVSNPYRPSRLSLVDTPGLARAVYVQNGFAYVASQWGGLQIVDVSEPAEATISGSLDTPWSVSVSVRDKYAYVADMERGLLVVDVSDPAKPSVIGSTSFPDSNGYPTLARDVYAAGNCVYVADDPNGLAIVDVSVPTSPSLLGTLGERSGAAWGVYVNETLAYLAEYRGLAIVDVSNPARPEEIGFYPIEAAVDVFVSGHYAYVTAENTGLHVIDVSDPAKPELKFAVSGYGAGVDASGGYVYMADQRKGLQVIYMPLK